MKCTLHVQIAARTAQLIAVTKSITDAQDVMQNMFELLQDLEKDFVTLAEGRMDKHRWTDPREFGKLVQSNCKKHTRNFEIFDAASWFSPAKLPRIKD